MCNLLFNEQFFSAYSKDLLGDPPILQPRTKVVFSINEDIFSQASVEQRFSKLDKHKPQGIDQFHPYILSEARSALSFPFSLIFKKSFTSGNVPTCWKQSNVTGFRTNQPTTAQSASLLSLAR